MKCMCLTQEEFKPYGQVLEPSGTPVLCNQGTAKRYNWVGAPENLRTGTKNGREVFEVKEAKPNLCVFSCEGYKGGEEFTIKLLERHLYSTQAFMPMAKASSTVRYLVIVCCNGSDDQPDLKTLKAFIANSSQGINYLPGCWHHPLIALDSDSDFACLVYENGSKDDCHIVDIDPHIVVSLDLTD
eukprot:Nk52_evm1s2243 gene=Nk52_evmTU1s2243